MEEREKSKKTNKSFYPFIIIISIVFIFPANADEIKFKGYVQSWLSYADQNKNRGDIYGFILRRVRLKTFGSLSKKIYWTVQFGWDKQSPNLVDAYINFLILDGLEIRVGKYTVPGTISSSLTPSNKLDFIERTQITQKWGANNGLSNYRSLGMMVHGNILKKKLFFSVMFANPRTHTTFLPGVKEFRYYYENTGPAFWGRLEAKPLAGLFIGSFIGMGKETDTRTRRKTFGVNLFYEKNGIKIKTEYIEGIIDVEGNKTEYSGFYSVIGYKIKKVEPIIQYESYY